MTKLSQDQEEELREIFKMFDRDGSGLISPSELKESFKMLNKTPSEAEAASMLRTMDTNRDGQIDFQEFARVVGRTLYRKHTNEEIRNTFELFDRDRNGFIDADELEQAFEKIGVSYSRADVDAMMKRVDSGKTGRITVDDFAKLLE